MAQETTNPSKQSIIGERYTFPAGIANSVISVSHLLFGVSAQSVFTHQPSNHFFGNMYSVSLECMVDPAVTVTAFYGVETFLYFLPQRFIFVAILLTSFLVTVAAFRNMEYTEKFFQPILVSQGINHLGFFPVFQLFQTDALCFFNNSAATCSASRSMRSLWISAFSWAISA